MISGYIKLWAGIGFFLLLLLPSPKTRAEAFIKLFVCGPLIWILFIPVSIHTLLKKRNG